jgi:hypothetical protein
MAANEAAATRAKRANFMGCPVEVKGVRNGLQRIA